MPAIPVSASATLRTGAPSTASCRPASLPPALMTRWLASAGSCRSCWGTSRVMEPPLASSVARQPAGRQACSWATTSGPRPPRYPALSSTESPSSTTWPVGDAAVRAGPTPSVERRGNTAPHGSCMLRVLPRPCSEASPRGETVDALEPAEKVAVQRLAALVETVPATGIEDQILGLARAPVDVLRAAIGQHLIGGAVGDQQRPRGKLGHGFGAPRLAAQRSNGDDHLAGRARGDHHRPAEGMPDQHDAAPALAAQQVQPQ